MNDQMIFRHDAIEDRVEDRASMAAVLVAASVILGGYAAGGLGDARFTSSWTPGR